MFQKSMSRLNTRQRLSYYIKLSHFDNFVFGTGIRIQISYFTTYYGKTKLTIIQTHLMFAK